MLIVLSASLERVQRSAVLAHEMSHIDLIRGIDHPDRQADIGRGRAARAPHGQCCYGDRGPRGCVGALLSRQDRVTAGDDHATEWEVPLGLAVVVLVALELAGERWAA